MKKYKGLILVIIPIVIVAIAMLLPISVEKSEQISIEGKIEISTRTYHSEVSGKITELNLNLGQEINKGDVLAVIDSAELEYQIKQLEITLAKAKAYVRDLQKPTTYPTQAQDIQIAKNALSLAEQNQKSLQMNQEKLQEDYDTAFSLYEAGGIAKSEVDRLETALKETNLAIESSNIQIATSKENIKKSQITNNPDMSEKIQMGILDIESLENQIAHLKLSLDKYTILAQDYGVTVAVNVDENALAMTGAKMFEISSENSKEFVFYLPEEYLDHINYGQEITITTKAIKDTAPLSYKAIINYIDLNSQYTPKEGENTANKNKLSFKVKALIQGDNNLKPSQKLDITIG